MDQSMKLLFSPSKNRPISQPEWCLCAHNAGEQLQHSFEMAMIKLMNLVCKTKGLQLHVGHYYAQYQNVFEVKIYQVIEKT